MEWNKTASNQLKSLQAFPAIGDFTWEYGPAQTPSPLPRGKHFSSVCCSNKFCVYFHKLSHNPQLCMCFQTVRKRGKNRKPNNLASYRKTQQKFAGLVLWKYWVILCKVTCARGEFQRQWEWMISLRYQRHSSLTAERKSVSQLLQLPTMTSPSCSPNHRQERKLKWLAKNGPLGAENEILLLKCKGGGRSREGQIDRRGAQELIKSAEEPSRPLPGSLPTSKAFWCCSEIWAGRTNVRPQNEGLSQ